MFTVSQILEQIPNEVGLEVQNLEKVLKLTKKPDKNRLNIAIEALNRIGLLENIKDRLYKKNLEQNVIAARIRCSSKGYSFAIRDDGEDDIYIRDHLLNHAWHGDRVLVKVTKDGYRRRSPEGSIICILERANRSILAIIDKEENRYIAKPIDDRIKGNIIVNNLKEYIPNNLYEIRIDKYPISQYGSIGDVVRPLTLNGGLEGDQELLLTKANISKARNSPKISLKQPIDKNRKDNTSQNSIIISGWETQNAPINPAIFISPLNGGFSISLHIPTIAERLSIGNNLDLWLRENSEAINIGSKWIPFLSQSLTTASKFNINEINHAITAQIDIDKSGSIIDWQFSLSTIKPKVELNKDLLIAVRSRKPKSRIIPAKLKPFKEYLSQIESLICCSEILKEKEINDGDIELSLNLPYLDNMPDLNKENPANNYTQWHFPINYEDVNSVISPIIRLVNKAWFKHINNLNLKGLINEAELADVNLLNDLAKISIALDIELNLDEDGSPSFKDLTEKFSKLKNRRVIDKILKNTLPEYNPNINNNNNNNNNKVYCPITYPGSSYQHLVNQYIQTILLKEAKTKENNRSKIKLDLGKYGVWKDIKWDLFKESSLKSINILTSESILNMIKTKQNQNNYLFESLLSLAQTRSVESIIGDKVKATISGVQSYGFFAELPPLNAEGLVHVSSLNDDWYEYRSRQNRLVGRKSKRTYQLGDEVLVKVLKVDLLKTQIDLEVITDDDLISSRLKDNDNTDSHIYNDSSNGN